MNFAIIARCDHTGEIGIGLISTSMAAGAHLDAAIRPHAGGILIQGSPSNRLNRLATNLLAQGHSARYVLQAVTSNDDDSDLRHIVIIDRESTLAIHHGIACEPACDIKAGPHYAVICEKSDGADASTISSAFESTQGRDFDDRLLRTLEAGVTKMPSQPAGPQSRSGALLVWGRRDYSDIDLRVDLHDDPINELRRIYSDFKPTAAYYEERARNPAQAVNALEFAGVLSAQREKKK